MIQPYYEQDGCTIYLGDCREILPQLPKVDITVSSPPYNMIPSTKPSGIFSEHNHKLNSSYATHEDNIPQDEYESFMREVFGLCLQKSLGVVWVNHKTKFIDKTARHPVRFLDFPIFSEIVWERPGSTTLNAKRYAPNHEFILGFGTPHFWDRCNDTKLTVWRINPETKVNGHPCPFPVEIPKRLISSSCPPSGVVLDPFMGSGTTLLAAKLEGRKATGIEICEKYCEIAANRLRQKVLF